MSKNFKEIQYDRKKFNYKNLNEYASTLLPTEKQMTLAQRLSAERNLIIPSPCLTDRRSMSEWLKHQLR
jgi:hypothetical protein